MYEIALLSRPKRNLMGLHYGVCLGNGYVFDFQPTGTQIITMQDFAGDFAVQKETCRYISAWELQDLISKLSKVNYDLVANNCEHIARLIVENKKESKQIALAGLVLIAGIIYLVSK
jgi:hypothetical protein